MAGAVLWILVVLCFSVIPAKLEICGSVRPRNKIINGQPADLGEFPWMAVLIYGEYHNATACGGSLINERYVLTAAHCVAGKIVEKVGNVTVVSLGEHDLTMEEDCVQIQHERICAPAPQIIFVESVHVHPGYSSKTHGHNDIALIKLADSAIYGDYVKPICLPDDKVLRKISVNVPTPKFTIAGWGKTEFGSRSDVLLQTTVFLSTNTTQCGDSHICAGGGRNDTCTGDSGGPLMFANKGSDKKLHYYVAGITSFGPKDCGMAGVPATYMNTASYLDWIGTIIKT